MILVVVPSLARGGAERTVSRLTMEWARSHSVRVAVFTAKNQAFPHGGELTDLALPATRNPLFKWINGMRRVARLRSIIRTSRPSRIVAFMETANFPVLLAAISCGVSVRTTVSVRGNPDHLSPIQKRLSSLLYRFADRIVVVSQGAAQRLAEIAPACARKVEVIYSPLPLQSIKAAASTAFAGSIPHAPYFFAAGRLVPGKAFDRMIRIFLEADCPNHQLLIAGDGPEREALQSQIDQAYIGHRVRLVGAVDNPFVWMKRATAFLMTSEHEGFPVVLIEAFACGCPVVAFDCDYGPREATRHGEAGFILAMKDEPGFASCLTRLAQNPALRDRMGRAAELRARDFDASVIAPQWIVPS